VKKKERNEKRREWGRDEMGRKGKMKGK